MTSLRRGLFDDSVGILGSGAAGLITAYTLLEDGFTNVSILTKDITPGGVWADHRVYPGLTINNVHGEFRFSPLAMPAPGDPTGRLSGVDMCAYMRNFADRFLDGKIRYGVTVKKVYRPRDGTGNGWMVDIDDGSSKKTLNFTRLVFCTGGCHTPSIPDSLSLTTAQRQGFLGRVFHSSQFRIQLDKLERSGQDVKSFGRVVIVGCGKSAQDISSYLAKKGVSVSVVFERTDAVVATSHPLPNFIRRSRFLGILAGHDHLETRLERFLHTTWAGAALTRFIWNKIQASSYDALCVPKESPLRAAPPLFWSTQTNDEGVPRDDSFYALVNKGRIALVSPARAAAFGTDGHSILLNDGRTLEADTVILATGYTSSWNIFDEQTSIDLGINRQAPNSHTSNRWDWDYRTLANPPHQFTREWASSLYRGIVPAKNLLNRDFAINGAIFTTNNGYYFEVVSHWISSYFLCDSYLRLPMTVEDALEECERNAVWIRQRYPGFLNWTSPSSSGNVAFWTWPQAMDDLLRDMGLRTGRSGGNWLTWPFKVIQVNEISTLGEERRARWQS